MPSPKIGFKSQTQSGATRNAQMLASWKSQKVLYPSLHFHCSRLQSLTDRWTRSINSQLTLKVRGHFFDRTRFTTVEVGCYCNVMMRDESLLPLWSIPAHLKSLITLGTYGLPWYHPVCYQPNAPRSYIMAVKWQSAGIMTIIRSEQSRD